MIKILKLKLVILLEYQNNKNNFPEGCTSKWSEEVFVTKKIENTVPWRYVITDLDGEEIVETFYEN